MQLSWFFVFTLWTQEGVWIIDPPFLIFNFFFSCNSWEKIWLQLKGTDEICQRQAVTTLTGIILHSAVESGCFVLVFLMPVVHFLNRATSSGQLAHNFLITYENIMLTNKNLLLHQHFEVPSTLHNEAFIKQTLFPEHFIFAWLIARYKLQWQFVSLERCCPRLTQYIDLSVDS